jgi:hypothetical protein
MDPGPSRVLRGDVRHSQAAERASEGTSEAPVSRFCAEVGPSKPSGQEWIGSSLLFLIMLLRFGYRIGAGDRHMKLNLVGRRIAR